MAEKAEIERHLSDAETAQRKLRDLSRNNSEGWKKAYVETRQQYRASMVTACELAEKYARSIDPAIADELTTLVKDHFQTLDIHQSKWPVLILSKDRSEEYRQSVAVVEAKHEELVTFLRHKL